MDEAIIPNEFFEQLISHFGEEVANRVKAGFELAPSVSVRINPSKPTAQFDHQKAVPWSSRAFLLDERPAFYLDPLFHTGTYYVQDSSSMVLEYVLNQITFESEQMLALDLCAAPGGKSTIIADRLKQNGFLIANEIDGKRNAILRENLLKWGSTNHAVTQLPADKFSDLGAVFDLIVVDAPCSGEGMFRKDDFAITQWTPQLVEQCALTQRGMLTNIAESLKEGGYLIYSTCRTNVQENEEQIQQLLSNGFELRLPKMDEFKNYIQPAEQHGGILGYYLLPGISTGEGLFISVLQKVDSAYVSRNKRPFDSAPFIRSAVLPYSNIEFESQWSKGNEVFGYDNGQELLQRLPSHMPFKTVGLPILEAKGRDFIPSHGLAMHKNCTPDVDLSLNDALNYLRKERISAPSNADNKWMTVGFEQIALGWVKQIPGRWNNYYPQHYRLRN